MRQVKQALQRDVVCLPALGMESIRKRRSLIHKQRQGSAKAPRFGHQIPVASKAFDTLHVAGADDGSGEHVARRLGVVVHAEGFGVVNDRGAALVFSRQNRCVFHLIKPISAVTLFIGNFLISFGLPEIRSHVSGPVGKNYH